MKSSLILTLLMLSFGPSAVAQRIENIECKSIGILSFSYAQLGWVSVSSAPALTDYCKNPELASNEIKLVFSQIKAAHEKVATFWRMPIKKILGEGFHVRLVENHLGPYISRYQEYSNLLELGIFPESSAQISAGVYVHELGHYLNLAKTSTVVPESERFLTKSYVFNEMLSDMMARFTNRVLIEADPQLPACLTNMREISTEQTFFGPTGEFDRYRAIRQDIACCQSSLAEFFDSKKFVNFCSAFKKLTERMSFPHFDESPLISANVWNLDHHLIGVPTQSFFKDLSQETGTAESDFLFFITRLDRARSNHRQYRCFLPSFKTEDAYQVSIPSVANLIKQYRNQLSPKVTPAFDQLWIKHGMDVFVKISDEAELIQLKDSVWNKWLYADSVYPPLVRSGCYNLSRQSPEFKPECIMECKLDDSSVVKFKR